MPRNTKRQGKRNELGRGLVIIDYGGPLVPSPGVAHPETGRAGLNEPVLLGRGRKREIRRDEELTGPLQKDSGLRRVFGIDDAIRSNLLPVLFLTKRR